MRQILLALPLLLAALPTALRAQADPAPAAARDSVAIGRAIFRGRGGCTACHGPAGQGSARGPDLTDRIWLHGEVSYEDVVRRVLHGVPDFETTSRGTMPPRGAPDLSYAEVRAVAAYVWSLSRPPAVPETAPAVPK